MRSTGIKDYENALVLTHPCLVFPRRALSRLLALTLVAVQFLFAPIAPHTAHALTSFDTKTTTDGLGSNGIRDVFALGSTVYAATAGGLSISHDGGNTFTNYTTANGLGSNSVLGVYAIAGTPHNAVYAATEGGISISIDGGVSFTNRTVAGPYGARSVFALPGTSGNAIYVGTSAGLEFSTDGGTTWQRKHQYDGSGLGGNIIEGVYAKAGTPHNIIYAATQTYSGSGAVSISTDGGNSFTNYTSGLNRPSATRDVYVDGATIYVAEYGVSISTDGGTTFTNYTTHDGLGNMSVYQVFAEGANVYVATTGGLSISSNGGISFTNYTSVNGLGSTITYGVHADGSTIYVATTGGLSISSNPAPTPTFDTPIRTDGGFTVNVTNYDANFDWTPSVSTGSVTAGTPSGSTLPLTVTRLSNGSTATVTVTTSRSGYSNGSATETGQAKSAQTLTWAPTAAITTVQSPMTPSSLATALGGAPVTYSVASNTTLTCTVDANSGVLTYTGTGTCVVRATAAATADYLEGTADVTFTVSRAAQSVTWAPVTALTLPGSTVTPAAATALGGAPISFSKVSNTTSTCEVDSSTGAITYAGAGDCVVRANAGSTADYDSGSIDVTFTVTKATPTLTWNPNLAVEVPDGSTTFTAATSSGDGAVTYAVTNAGTTGCSLPSSTSRTLSFTAAGSCEVTATAAATTDYNAVSSVKTFAVSKATQLLSWSPSSTLTLATLSATLPAATTSGDGAISYSVTSAGGTGCAFADATQPVLTYTTAGSCSVTATAAETVGYAQGTQSVTITISLATPTLSWSPTTALSMPAATVTPAAASTTADGGINYAVTSDTGAGCSVDANTGALSYTATGQCQITATSTATSRYAAGSTAVTFSISLAPQAITANATSTSLRPGQTTTVSASGSSGSGNLTWTRTTGAGVCSLTGTTVRALADGACVLTVDIAPDSTYAAASDSITITVSTPPPAPGGGLGGGGGAAGGTSSADSSPSRAAGASSGSGGSGNGSGSGTGTPTSQDGVTVPGSSSPTSGRTLPPPPADVAIKPVPGRSRSAVLIKQPSGVAGSQVTSTVVVVRDDTGKVVSRINVALKKGQGEIEVTVPFVADGYTVNVYNVNDVGVSTGGLRTSPLIKATTITKRTSSGRPALFGTRLGKPIVFAGGSARLDAGDRRELRAIARKVKVSNDRLFVTGFALKGGGGSTEVGPLSTARAKAAATYLAKQGVRVWIRYWGAGALNGTGKATDRRVEIRTSSRPIPRSLVP